LARQGGTKNIEAREPTPITETWAASVLPRRLPGAHKWSVGGVVVVAGSPQFAGAAALCCAGAGRSGAGIVVAALPRSIAAIVVGHVPEATVVFLPDGESPSVAARAAEAIGERLQRAGSLVVGPGLGDDEAAGNLLGALFGSPRNRSGIGFGLPGRSGEHSLESGTVVASERPVVVDADALNWLAAREGWWAHFPRERLVLTPHAGEMARLVKQESQDVVGNAVVVARDAASNWGQTVVLKGSPTLVASPDGSIISAPTPVSLATAGSGDVLSGSIAAFLAQGLSPRDAAGLAVFVGSRAAERLEQRYGTLGVIAGDMPVAIAEELCALEQMGD
jgi:NAD(P)H-hydrate repair Nnr-like enzyme with NAD(P)H-hydrate dehydratase domain